MTPADALKIMNRAPARPATRTGPSVPGGVGVARPGLGDAVTMTGMNATTLADSQTQLAALQAYFAVLTAGGTPTASQLAAAQSALSALAVDVQLLQQQQSMPGGGQRVWVSAPAAGAIGVGAAIVGGVLGYVVRGRNKGASR